MFAAPSVIHSNAAFAQGAPAGVSVHAGANAVDDTMRMWHPPLQSFDASFLPEAGTLIARTEDIARNSPLAAASIRLQLHKTVGDNFRLAYEPETRLVEGATAGELSRFEDSVEMMFAVDAEGDGNFFDAGGRMNFTEMVALSEFCNLTRGEAITLAEWQEGPRSRGNRPFATCFQIINPDRVHTPPAMTEDANLRAGFRLTKLGYAFGMYVMNRHPGDWLYANLVDDVYRYVTRTTPWGRAKWLHLFTPEAADQSRGRSQMIAGLKEHQSFSKLHEAVVSNVLTQALYAAVIKSPDPTTAFDGIQGLAPEFVQKATDLQRRMLMDAQADYYGEDRGLHMNGVKIAHMFPGDEFEFLTANQGLEFYDPFSATLLRQLARTVDVSYEEYTGDYTKTNYSGARAGDNTSNMARDARRARGPAKQARFMFFAWLEEQCALGRVRCPGSTARRRLNWFLNNRDALSRARFHGPGTPHIDPTKSVEAAMMEVKLGVMSRHDYCNEYKNVDWKRVADKLAEEKRYGESIGIDLDTAIGIAPAPVAAAAIAAVGDDVDTDADDDEDGSDTDDDSGETAAGENA